MEEEDLAAKAPFPKKLFDIVANADIESVAWEQSGRAFRILDPERFVEFVLPKYFKHNKLSSFQRQLNLYGFRRITKGEMMGAYYHPRFQRDNHDTSCEIRRLHGRSNTPAETKKKAAVVTTEEVHVVKAVQEPVAGFGSKVQSVLSDSDFSRPALDRTYSMSVFDEDCSLQIPTQPDSTQYENTTSGNFGLDDMFWDSFEKLDSADINVLVDSLYGFQ